MLYPSFLPDTRFKEYNNLPHIYWCLRQSSWNTTVTAQINLFYIVWLTQPIQTLFLFSPSQQDARKIRNRDVQNSVHQDSGSAGGRHLGAWKHPSSEPWYGGNACNHRTLELDWILVETFFSSVISQVWKLEVGITPLMGNHAVVCVRGRTTELLN